MIGYMYDSSILGWKDKLKMTLSRFWLKVAMDRKQWKVLKAFAVMQAEWRHIVSITIRNKGFIYMNDTIIRTYNGIFITTAISVHQNQQW